MLFEYINAYCKANFDIDENTTDDYRKVLYASVCKEFVKYVMTDDDVGEEVKD